MSRKYPSVLKTSTTIDNCCNSGPPKGMWTDLINANLFTQQSYPGVGPITILRQSVPARNNCTRGPVSYRSVEMVPWSWWLRFVELRAHPLQPCRPHLERSSPVRVRTPTSRCRSKLTDPPLERRRRDPSRLGEFRERRALHESIDRDLLHQQLSLIRELACFLDLREELGRDHTPRLRCHTGRVAGHAARATEHPICTEDGTIPSQMT